MKKSILTIIVATFLITITYGLAFSAPITYKVKSGDSLCSIAKKHQIHVDKLKSQNNLKTNKLSIGQQITIKSDSTGATGTTKATTKTKPTTKTRKEVKNTQPVEVVITENDGEFIEYKTKKGDTIDKIATQFNIDTEDILEANNLTDKKFKPGKVILIPKIIEDKDDEFVTLAGKTIKPWKSNDEKYMLVKVAKSFMGAPYRYGGESVRGLDCSAYVKKIYDIFDVPLPRSAREQFNVGEKITKDDLAVGDLVFFRTKRYIKYPTHVGIYIGEGNFIHSSSGYNKLGVKIDSLLSDFYGRTFIGAVRVKKTSEESADTTKASEKATNNS
ncbi:MAG: NlpC/P60 family protein [Proteobacteria bacterium]|nr:NlpC/P60 family protein [Pseudomonadota bacterium]